MCMCIRVCVCVCVCVLTNVVSRVSLLPSYTADKINRFKLGALLQKDRDHKGYDGYT